jgi:hypothetical protein
MVIDNIGRLETFDWIPYLLNAGAGSTALRLSYIVGNRCVLYDILCHVSLAITRIR